MERAIGRLYEFQVVCIDGETTIGKLDAFRAFAERSSKLLSLSAFLGLVVPSAFHANEGATGIRQLFIDRMNLLTCFSFENRKQIFEIHRSFKFALIVARSGIGQDLTNCAFYLQEVDWLRQANQADRLLCYDRKFIERTGGRHLTLIELQSQLDLAIAEQVFLGSSFFGDTAESLSVRLGRELNMTDDAFRFVSVHGEGDPRDPDIANSLRDQGYIPFRSTKHLVSVEEGGCRRVVVVDGASAAGWVGRHPGARPRRPRGASGRASAPWETEGGAIFLCGRRAAQSPEPAPTSARRALASAARTGPSPPAAPGPADVRFDGRFLGASSRA